jgi:hypothetical protein
LYCVVAGVHVLHEFHSRRANDGISWGHGGNHRVDRVLGGLRGIPDRITISMTEQVLSDLKEAALRGSLWVWYVVEQVLTICKVAVGSRAGPLQREVVGIERVGRDRRERWQSILGQMRL